MALLAVPFSERHWAEYQEWHADNELSHRTSYPDTAWFEYATSKSPERSVVAFEEVGTGRFLSLAQYDIEENEIFLFIAVRPEIRGQGVGRETLKSVVSASPLSLNRIVSHVEANNAASIALVRGAGFRPVTPIADEEGFLTYRLDLIEG